MKEKLKKFFSKDNLFIFICTILIALIVFFSVLYHKKDVENMNNKNESSINLIGDNLDLNKNVSYINGSNSLQVHSLNYYQSFNVYDLAFRLGDFSEGVADFGSFYITNRELLSCFRNAFYIDEGENNFYLRLSFSYNIIFIDNNSNTISFDVPLWVNFNGSYLNRNDYRDFLVNNYANYFSSIYFEDNNIITDVNYSIDITDYLQRYSGVSSADIDNLPIEYITFTFLTRIADANYSSSDKTLDITLSYLNNNLFNYENRLVGQTLSATGVLNSNDNYFVLDYTPVKPNTIYTIGGKTDAFKVFYDSNYNYIGYNNDIYVFTTPSNCAFIRTDSPNAYNNVYLFEGSNVLPFQYYYDIDNYPFADWCSTHNVYISNFSSSSTEITNLSTKYNSLLNDYNNLNNDYNNLNNDYNNLNNDYNSLDLNYNSLLDQYNLLAQNEYTFSELFWSISAVPFGVLTSAFNVNVMGINLAGVITGLLTSMVLLWLIKRLFK